MVDNTKHRPKWYTEKLEKRGKKRSGAEAARPENATKTSKIEENNFV